MLDAIRAARAYVETFFDDGAAKGIRQLESQLKGMGDTATAAGGKLLALSAPILGFGAFAASQFAAAGSELTDLSAVTQISIQDLGELKYAAGQLGGSLEGLAGGFQKQTKFLGQVKDGSKEAHATLAELGLSVEDVAGLTSDQAFGVFADAINGIENETDKMNMAMAVFGKSGTSLLPVLSAGSAGIEEMRKQAHELGVVMSDEDAASADELGDLWEQLSQQSEAITDSVGAALAPAFLDLFNAVSPLLTETIAWIKENGDLISQIFLIASGVAAGGAALVGMGVAASTVAAGLGGVATIASVVGAVLGGLLSPIGLVGAGIAGLIAYAVDFSDVWDAVTEELGESLGLAADLIQNGEITAAFDLVWAQIETTWASGVQSLVKSVVALVSATLRTLEEGLNRLEPLLKPVRNSLARGLNYLGDATGITEGAYDELVAMQEAGQEGSHALAGLAASLDAASEGFGDLGGNVGEAQARLDELKRKSIALNEEADREREADALAKTQQGESTKKTGVKPEPLLNMAAGGQAGTFSAFASRQLYSFGSGESPVVTAVGKVESAIGRVETAIKAKQKVGT